MVLREAVIAVTYRCNLRCSMCNIWQNKSHSELAPSEYLKLPRTLKTINVTGGEPFLRDDLHEVIQAIHSVAPRARLVISSNGYLTNTILKQMLRIRSIHPRTGIGISIDGSEETHDRIRGVSGSYARAVETAKLLRGQGFTDLRFGMTITPDNLGEAESVYLLAKDIGVQFTATYAHNSEVYFGKSDNPSLQCQDADEDSLRRVIRRLLSTWSPKNWFRAYHLGGVLDPSLRTGYYGRCKAGSRYVFIAPDGSVYPCNVMNLKVGNMKNASSWDDVITEERRAKMVCAVRQCRSDCWMVCNTRSLISSSPLRAIAWIVRMKLKFAVCNG